MLGGALLALAASVIPPVDQCKSDAGFVQFRNELRRAIDRRNADALLKLVADDVYASFGGYVGKADFIEMWKLAKDPKESLVWKELGEALELGCAIDGQARVAPSFDKQVDEKRDPFDTWIALPGAVLRETPSDSSRAIARLRWDILTLDKAVDDESWLLVKLDDGRSGYVRASKTRSVLGWRAAFEMRGGRWLMTSFVAGD
jgi:hypothetical protein